MSRILFIVLTVFSFSSHAVTIKTIHEAASEGLVKMTYQSTGKMNGESVSLGIEILKGGAFKMIVPGGTVFRTIDSGDQDMLVVEEQELLVSSKTKSYTVRGFCCQSYNSVPDYESGFTLDRYKNKGIDQLIAFLPQKNIDKDQVQDAIWAICNKEVPSGLFDSSNPNVASLRKMICGINGVEEPWYETKRRVEIREDRSVERLPVSVEAKLEYVVEKPGGKLNYLVLDEAGKVVRTYQSQSNFSQKGNYKMNFKLTVSGWDSGKYTLILKMDDSIMKKYDFQV